MIIRNTSRYADADIKALIRFAVSTLPALDTTALCINVKNSASAYAGRAYPRVPAMSNAPKGMRYLVTLRIGSPDRFPADNMSESVRWTRVSAGEAYLSHEVRSCVRTVNGIQERWLERRNVLKHPYGGIGSPLLTYRTWMEAFVGLAAHELNHILQFQNKAPLSEIRCEKAAERALNRFLGRQEAK